jgi:hypothetical protein
LFHYIKYKVSSCFPKLTGFYQVRPFCSSYCVFNWEGSVVSVKGSSQGFLGHDPVLWYGRICRSISWHHVLHLADGGSKVQSVGNLSQHYTLAQPRKPLLESSLLWKPQILNQCENCLICTHYYFIWWKYSLLPNP